MTIKQIAFYSGFIHIFKFMRRVITMLYYWIINQDTGRKPNQFAQFINKLHLFICVRLQSQKQTNNK